MLLATVQLFGSTALSDLALRNKDICEFCIFCLLFYSIQLFLAFLALLSIFIGNILAYQIQDPQKICLQLTVTNYLYGQSSGLKMINIPQHS